MITNKYILLNNCISKPYQDEIEKLFLGDNWSIVVVNNFVNNIGIIFPLESINNKYPVLGI